MPVDDGLRGGRGAATGPLGSRGAALLDPYTDDAKNSGLILTPPDYIKAVAVKALKTGFQVNTHAIGDRGNRVALDLYEAALKEVPTADHRFRVEHAQIVDHAGPFRIGQRSLGRPTVTVGREDRLRGVRDHERGRFLADRRIGHGLAAGPSIAPAAAARRSRTNLPEKRNDAISWPG